MKRLLFLILASSSGLRATSFTFASCTVGTTTQTSTGPTSSSCNLNGPPVFIDGVNVTGSVGALGIVDSAFESGGPGNLDVSASASADGVFPSGLAFSAAGGANDGLSYLTKGPARTGFIHVDLTAFLFNGELGDFDITDGVHRYNSNTIPLNSATYTLPFDLGSPFQVSVSTSTGPISAVCGEDLCPNGEVKVVFSLLEANGTTPVPFFVTPEPSTCGLVFVGLAAGTWFLFRRDCRRRRLHR
jgi:hypothetical protein